MTSRFVREALVVTALMLWMPLPALAQQTIAGRLISEGSHLPIGNARLSLLDDSDHVVARTVSDSVRGEFYLDAPKPGRYAVSILVGRGGRSRSPDFQLDSGQVIERSFAVPDFPAAVLEAFLPDDVTKRAAIVPGQRRLLRYPPDLWARDRSGIVRTTFVVGADGRADMKTFRVLESADPAFTEAVRVMISRMQYIPAERAGTVVSQVYDQTVEFLCEDGSQRVPVVERNSIVLTASGCRR